MNQHPKTRWTYVVGLGTAAAALSIASRPGVAETMLYTSRIAFEADAPSLAVETLEDDPIGILRVPASLQGSALVVDTSPTTVTTEVTTNQSYSYNTTPGGSKHLRFIDYGPEYDATLLSPAGFIWALGFDLSGFQDFESEGGFFTELRMNGAIVDAFMVPDPGSFAPSFHGFISDTPFDSVSMTFRGADFVGLDDIAFGAPEPAALVLLSVSSLPLLRRRRR